MLKSPVLDREAAQTIVAKAFLEARDRNPERLVIHKTSKYSFAEIQGFEDALTKLKIAYDLVSVGHGETLQ